MAMRADHVLALVHSIAGVLVTYPRSVLAADPAVAAGSAAAVGQFRPSHAPRLKREQSTLDPILVPSNVLGERRVDDHTGDSVEEHGNADEARCASGRHSHKGEHGGQRQATHKAEP